MNAGLWNKALREIALVTLLCAAGLAIFEGLVSYIFWTYQRELTEDLLQIEFVRDVIQSLVGGSYEGPLGPDSLRSLAWVHPLVLSIVFAHAIAVATRVPAGEIDRGVADMLFALPVPRVRIFLHEFLAMLVSGALVVGAGLLGAVVGYRFIPVAERPELAHLTMVGINLYVLGMTVAGLATLLSSASDRRGRAIGASFGFVLLFLVWSFLAQYSKGAERLLFLNILDYHRPLSVLNDGVFPARDIGVLLVCAAALWGSAGAILTRRDIATL